MSTDKLAELLEKSMKNIETEQAKIFDESLDETLTIKNVKKILEANNKMIMKHLYTIMKEITEIINEEQIRDEKLDFQYEGNKNLYQMTEGLYGEINKIKEQIISYNLATQDLKKVKVANIREKNFLRLNEKYNETEEFSKEQWEANACKDCKMYEDNWQTKLR